MEHLRNHFLQLHEAHTDVDIKHEYSEESGVLYCIKVTYDYDQLRKEGFDLSKDYTRAMTSEFDRLHILYDEVYKNARC